MQIQTLNISLPRDLVKKADAVAEGEYQTRSEFIKDLLVAHLKQRETWEELFIYGQKIGKRMGIKSEEDVYKIVDDYRSGK